MQPYDFLMIAVMAGLTLYGYSKGMAWQLAYLASLIASYFVALKFADQFAPMFGQSAPFNKFVAMLVIYVATSFVIWMLFRVVRKMIDSVKMEGFDHQMGALIGFARGVLWCVGITFFAVTLLPQNMKESIVSTRSGRTIAMLLDKTESVVPPEVHQVIGPVIQRIEQKLQEGQPAGAQQPPYSQQGPSQQGVPQQGWSAAGTAPQNPAANPGWPNPGQAAWPQTHGAGAFPPSSPGASQTPAQTVNWPNANP